MVKAVSLLAVFLSLSQAALHAYVAQTSLGGVLYLVNRRYVLSQHYEPEDLVAPRVPGGDKTGTLMREEAALALEQLFAAALAEGQELVASSGYRSYKKQATIWDNKVSQVGQRKAQLYVAPPGASEHQTGLAVDLGENKPPIDFICPAFPDRGFCRAFRLAAPDFGFILRYREEKEKITGIAREPWHFRYVGFPHSRIITDRGMALEEYLDFLPGFPFADKPLVYQAGEGTVYRIGYLPAPPQNGAGRTVAALKLPAGSRYSISGDNKAGFIITTKVKKRRGRP